MKPFILVAAVAAFELAFVASIAGSPSPAPETVAAARAQAPGQHALAQRAGEPVPCSPPG
jgi:hypothetical protein